MEQVVHKGQHLLKHKATEIKYYKSGVWGTVQTALDDLYSIAGASLNWKSPVDTKGDLPIVGNAINDARVVQDEPALYVCIALVGAVDDQWLKIADYDWGSIFDGTVNDGDLVKKNGVVLTKADEKDIMPRIIATGVTDGDIVKYNDTTKKFDVATAEDVMGLVLDVGVSDGDLVQYNEATHKFVKVTGISEMLIISKHVLATFTTDAGIQEKGVTLNAWNFSWTYNRNTANPASQSISPIFGAQAVGNRSLAVVAGALTTTTTYTISCVGDDTNTSSLTSTIYFQSKRYMGVSSDEYTTGADIITNIAPQSNLFVTSRVVSKLFDASVDGGDNYLYIVYPAVLGSPTGTKIGGIDYNDYTETVVSLTNSSGHTENYIILRTNSKTSSSSITWEIF